MRANDQEAEKETTQEEHRHGQRGSTWEDHKGMQQEYKEIGEETGKAETGEITQKKELKETLMQ